MSYNRGPSAILVGLVLAACGLPAASSVSTPLATTLASLPVSSPTPSPVPSVASANGLLAIAAPADPPEVILEVPTWHVRAEDESGQVLWTVRAGQVVDLRWSPDGEWLAIVETHAVAVVSADGQTTAFAAAGFRAASWSSDSTMLAIEKLARISLYDLATDQDTQVGPNWWLAGSEWSPDGESVLFTSSGQQFDPMNPPVGEPMDRIYRLSLADDVVEPLTGDSYHRGVCWSPDGTRIAFFETDGVSFANNHGVVLDVASGVRTDILSAGWGRCPWSPDGQQLLVDSRRAVWIASDEGKEESLVATARPDQLVTALGWSSDGEWVLVRREAESGTEPATLEAIRVDGSENRALGDGFVAAWQPVTP